MASGYQIDFVGGLKTKSNKVQDGGRSLQCWSIELVTSVRFQPTEIISYTMLRITLKALTVGLFIYRDFFLSFETISVVVLNVKP